MMRKGLGLLAMGAALSVLPACGTDTTGEDAGPEETTTGAAEGTGEAAETLVLGLVPSGEVDRLVEEAGELGALLESELGVPVETTVSHDYADLVVAMQTGQADIGMFGPIALVQAADVAGAVPVLQSIRFGSGTYHTQWMTNDPGTFCLDEVVEDQDGLKHCNGTLGAAEGPIGEDAIARIEPGSTISFVDQISASGYFYPATQWGEATGEDPIGSLDATFAGSHHDSVVAVSNGDIPVGVSFDDARAAVLEDEPSVADNVVVFAYSTEIPNDGIAVAGDLPKKTQDSITEAFLSIAGTEQGRAVLEAVYAIEGLEPADREALDAARAVANNFGE